MKYFKVGSSLPAELRYPRLIAETGLPPDILDNMDLETVENLVLYKQIKDIAVNGGEYSVG